LVLKAQCPDEDPSCAAMPFGQPCELRAAGNWVEDEDTCEAGGWKERHSKQVREIASRHALVKGGTCKCKQMVEKYIKHMTATETAEVSPLSQVMPRPHALLPCALVLHGIDSTFECKKFWSAVQRKMVKRFPVGTRVDVFSKTAAAWVTDGVVIDFITGGCERDGHQLRAGSTKVCFNEGRSFKWVVPQHVDDQLRRSKEVPVKPKSFALGDLETVGYSNKEHPDGKVYFEVHGGYVQWWESLKLAQDGKPSQGHIDLANAHVELQVEQGCKIEPRRGCVSFFGQDFACLELQFESQDHRNWWWSALKSSENTTCVDTCDELQSPRRKDTIGGDGVAFRAEFLKEIRQESVEPTLMGEVSSGTVLWLQKQKEKVAVFKPAHMEGFERDGIKAGEGAIREEAVYIVDRLCGEEARVPVTTRTTMAVGDEIAVDDPGPWMGAVQRHVNSRQNGGSVVMPKGIEEALTVVSQEDAEALALLDLRVFNTDRHEENLLFLEDGNEPKMTPVPIDHGCCLPPWWALGEAVFDAWKDWPQLAEKPTQQARAVAAEARRQLPESCKLLAELPLDSASIATLRICTNLVAVGVADLGLPLAKLALLLVRDSNRREFSWLETCVFTVAKQQGAQLSVHRDIGGEKRFSVTSYGPVEKSLFIDNLVTKLVQVFRNELAATCAIVKRKNLHWVSKKLLENLERQP